jgi:three-Cys-motif partner protein
MVEHRFGGPWTQLKLDVLRKYLHFYAKALKNQKFQLIYIDAFAGSGSSTCCVNGEDIQLDGSASIALNSTPPFDEYIFIENHAKRFSALKTLCESYEGKKIRLCSEDANGQVRKLCTETDWKNTRAVMFLDPYGLEVDWETIEAIANTRAIDLWYLFSLSGLYRQAALDLDAVDEHKAARLTACLGTDGWEQAFYCENKQHDFFKDTPGQHRHADVDVMEKFVKEERLKAIFGAVAPPLRLPLQGAPLYSLFFAVANRSGPAIGLSMKVAKYILDHQRNAASG